MKKLLLSVLLLVACLSLSTAAFAVQHGTAEYEKMKEIKKAQRAAKEQQKANPVEKEKTKGFWQREAERSGFAGTGAMFGNAISGVLPVDKPNSGKTEK